MPFGATSPAAASAAQATPLTQAEVPLANGWSQWRPGRSGPPSRLASASRARRLVLSVGGRAPVGTTVYLRLVLPATVTPTTMSFRIAYSTPGAIAFISRGTLATRVWSRSGGRARTVVGRVRLDGKRAVYIGLRRRAPAAARATVTVRAYAISTPGSPTPLPAGSAAGTPTASKAAPAPAPGAVYTGPEVYWGARIGGGAVGAGGGGGAWGRPTVAGHAGGTRQRGAPLAPPPSPLPSLLPSPSWPAPRSSRAPATRSG